MANVIKLKRGSGSDPSASDLVVGEVAIRTDSGKLFTKKDNGSIAEISGSGGGSDIFINTLSSSSGSGGGSATFNGTATRFTLSNPPSVSAQQLLVSINGVVQKPNSGTSPSEGFAIDGNDIIFAAAPATGSDFFIVTYGSLNIAVPADNSVTSAKIVDGAIVNADINASAAIQGTKVSPNFGSQNIVTTGGLTIDTSTLHVDTSNNRVGIGTTLPSQELTVAGSDPVISVQEASVSSQVDIGTGTSTGFINIQKADGTRTIQLNGSGVSYFNSGGNVAIGTTSASLPLTVVGANNTTFDHVGTISLQGTDAYNSGNAGAGINFSGKYNSSGNTTTLAQISGIKEDTGDGTYDGALTFGVRNDAEGVNIERLRIGSDGKVDLNASVAKFGNSHSTGTTYLFGHDIRFTNEDITSTKLVIDSSGRVSIGINSAAGLNASSDDLVVGNYNVSTDRGITIGSNTNGSIRFADNGNGSAGILEYMHGSANLFKMHANTTASTTAVLGLVKTNAATNAQVTMITFEAGNQARGQIKSSSSDSGSPSFAAYSDYRMKENIRNYTGGWNNIKAVPVKLFDITTDGSKDQKGWIAHELQAVLPDLVQGAKDAVVTQAMVDNEESDEKELGNPIYQTVSMGLFMPDVISALQTAIAKIETLETKVAALEAG